MNPAKIRAYKKALCVAGSGAQTDFVDDDTVEQFRQFIAGDGWKNAQDATPGLDDSLGHKLDKAVQLFPECNVQSGQIRNAYELGVYSREVNSAAAGIANVENTLGLAAKTLNLQGAKTGRPAIESLRAELERRNRLGKIDEKRDQLDDKLWPVLVACAALADIPDLPGAGSYVLLSQCSAGAPEATRSPSAPVTAQSGTIQPQPEASSQLAANPPGLPPPPPPLPGVLPIPIPQAAPAPAAPSGNTQVAAVPPPQPLNKPVEFGTSMRDCQGCPELVRLAGGSFRMGSNEDPSEAPVHLVRVAPFALGRYPVTVAEWNQCAAANACTFSLEGNATAPARNVSFDDARQYVAWLSKITGQPYRLPSEAEWEYAARAGTNSRYWWGDRVVPKMANCKGCGDSYDPRQPAPIGSFPANALGLHDLVGGVAQWVEDCWHPNYQGAPVDGSAWNEPNCRENVLRGGSWRNDASYTRSASRAYYDSGVRYPAHGFRVARSL